MRVGADDKTEGDIWARLGEWADAWFSFHVASKSSNRSSIQIKPMHTSTARPWKLPYQSIERVTPPRPIVS